MPAPDDGFEELFYLDSGPSLERFARMVEPFLNRFSEVRNVRIGRVGVHEERGWILRFHAPIGEYEARRG